MHGASQHVAATCSDAFLAKEGGEAHWYPYRRVDVAVAGDAQIQSAGVWKIDTMNSFLLSLARHHSPTWSPVK